MTDLSLGSGDSGTTIGQARKLEGCLDVVLVRFLLHFLFSKAIVRVGE